MEVESKQLYFFIILTALSLKINASPVTEDEIDTPPMNTTLGEGLVDPHPNIRWTKRGVDIAKKNPLADDSHRDYAIFIFEDTNSCNNLLPFVDSKGILKCSTSFEEKAWGSFKEYSESSSTSSMKSFSMGYTAPTVTLGISDPSGVASIEVTPVPNSVNVGMGNTDSTLDMEYFFNQEGGSVSRSRLACGIYDVTVDIDNPTLKLTIGFIADIKKIDQAKTDLEQKAVMKKFIYKYGTHYAKHSKMGVGMEFETRYNQEETRDNTVKQRNHCSSVSGGFSLAGIGATSESKECESFNAGANNARSSRAKRTESTTYGVLPSKGGLANVGAWGTLVHDMWKAGTLLPMPIKQELEPIYKILLTDAVKKIVRDDGKTQIDHKKVIKTAVKYYSEYCTVMEDCDFPACPKTVELDGDLYHDTGLDNEGRKRYDNNEKGMSLVYHEGEFINGWEVVDSFKLTDVKKKTAPCPTVGGKFVSVLKPLKHVVSTNWKVCSIHCQNFAKCNFWQYRKIDTGTECRLFEDFDSIEKSDAPADSDPTNDYHIGSKDCPGDDKASQSSFGQCPNTFKAKSMWIEDGTFFNKNSRVVAVCETSCSNWGLGLPQGYCNEYGTCTCNDGFAGTDCSIDLNGCSDYENLDDPNRNKNYKTRAGTYKCDRPDNDNMSPDWKGGNLWYRFTGQAGTQLADSVVPFLHCGGTTPGWLIGAHPVTLGENVIRQVCFTASGSKHSCYSKIDVEIKQCGGFYIYKFKDTPRCGMRYCGQY